MRDFFGTPWDDLAVEHLESFLADAGDEGLTWEAKGREEPHRDSVRKVVCGLANSSGGFFIVGAERGEGTAWTLDGAPFRSDEPGTWLSSLITDGINPVPPFDLKIFDRADGRKAAVVGVEPVSVPPCITATGAVYQRVSGQTLPVTDQRVLAELYGRGRAVRERAEALALRAAGRALREPGPQSNQESMFSVAPCPTQGPEDKAAVLFTESFAKRVVEVVQARLQVDAMVRYPVGADVRQDSIRAWPSSGEMGSSWTAAVYWDGSVSAVFTTASTELYLDELTGHAKQAWKVLSEVASGAGGAGETHVVVRVRPEHAAVAGRRQGHPTEPVQRWTELRPPADEELAHLERELQRGFGRRVWDPEPD